MKNALRDNFFLLSSSTLFNLQTPTIPFGLSPQYQTIAISRPEDYRVKLSVWIFFKKTLNTQSFRQWEMQFLVSQRLEVALNLRAATCSLWLCSQIKG